MERGRISRSEYVKSVRPERVEGLRTDESNF
jgi:hypothetical protein